MATWAVVSSVIGSAPRRLTRAERVQARARWNGIDRTSELFWGGPDVVGDLLQCGAVEPEDVDGSAAHHGADGVRRQIVEGVAQGEASDRRHAGTVGVDEGPFHVRVVGPPQQVVA